MKKYLLVLVLILTDFITKFLVKNYLENTIEIFSWFKLQFIMNSGIAFSIYLPPIFIIFFTIIIIFFLIWWLKKTSKKLEKMAIFLILAGAIGNLIDRFLYGAVVDFLSFWNFPIFNFADIFVSVGVGLLILDEFFKKK